MTDAAVSGVRGEAGRGTVAAPGSADEPVELKYLRHTRNATVFLAALAGVLAALSLVGAIVVGVQLSKISNQLGGSSGYCASLGGTDTSC